MRVFPTTVAALLCALAVPQALASCYVIYDANDQVLYRSVEPPVDLSLPLHQALPQVAPGGRLVFTLSNHGCEASINRLTPKMALPAPAAGTVPAQSKG